MGPLHDHLHLVICDGKGQCFSPLPHTYWHWATLLLNNLPWPNWVCQLVKAKELPVVPWLSELLLSVPPFPHEKNHSLNRRFVRQCENQSKKMYRVCFFGLTLPLSIQTFAHCVNLIIVASSFRWHFLEDYLGALFKFHCDSLLGPKPVTEMTVVHTVGAACGHTQPTQILTFSRQVCTICILSCLQGISLIVRVNQSVLYHF